MVFVSYRLNNLVKTCSWEEAKKSSIPVSAYIWVDVKNPSEEEKLAVQNDLEITFPTREELEEIESSARYSESDDEITANSSYLLQFGSVNLTSAYQTVQTASAGQVYRFNLTGYWVDASPFRFPFNLRFRVTP